LVVARDRALYKLPSNGARPGSPQMPAGRAGPFHAVIEANGVAAWLSRVRPRERMTWPADWSVRFDPLELISPDGEVFAREGDWLVAGGGYGSDDNEWLVQSLSRDDPLIDRLCLRQKQRRPVSDPKKP
jgi:hypothetical protein